MKCVIKTNPDYQILKHRSGLSDTTVMDAKCYGMINKVDRLPRLDEFYNESEKVIKKDLKLNRFNETNSSELLDSLLVSTYTAAQQKLNKDFANLEVLVIPISESSIVKIKKRPFYTNEQYEKGQVDPKLKNPIIFELLVNKLGTLYGIPIKSINNNDLTLEPFKGKGFDGAAAFIKDGNIYINRDIAKADAPAHELMHLFLGSIKANNPEVYGDLIGMIEQLPDYELLVSMHPNRSRSDVNEEIFVTEFAKYITGMPSKITSLTDQLVDELSYNFYRMFDSILMGAQTSRTLDITDLFSKPLTELAEKLGSNVFLNQLKLAYEHRLLANYKEKLFKNNELEEICE